jgi:hypothetical protein
MAEGILDDVVITFSVHYQSNSRNWKVFLWILYIIYVAAFQTR